MASGGTLTQLVASRRDEVIGLRRAFHSQAETAFQEHATARMVKEQLERLDLRVKDGIGGTGVLGWLPGTASGGDPARSMLVRADIDALPIAEQTGLEFAATTGAMHACGHDGHIAIALGLAMCLKELTDKFSGEVILLFQPAEEIGAGARAMLDDGLMDLIAPTRALSLHIANPLELGTVGLNEGLIFAATNMFTITITGRGGHAAAPQLVDDPVVAAGHTITAIQSVVTRNVPPGSLGLVTIGSVHGGDAGNVVPEQVVLKGTMRAASNLAITELADKVEQAARSTAAAHGATAAMTIDSVVPAVVNDAAVARDVAAAAAEVVGEERVGSVEPFAYGDDVSEFINRIPGTYFLLGAGSSSKQYATHHHPEFDFDERCLEIGVAIMANAALSYLG